VQLFIEVGGHCVPCGPLVAPPVAVEFEPAADPVEPLNGVPRHNADRAGGVGESRHCRRVFVSHPASVVAGGRPEESFGVLAANV
jgi:hypothetical protein